MQLVIRPTYEEMREWIQSLPETFSQSGRVLYDARNQIRAIETPWGEMNVKRYHRPALLNRMVYSWIRTPKAVRAYVNAERLQRLSIATPEPIAYLIIEETGLIAESYLITRQSPLKRRMYEFREHGIEGYEHIIRALAHLAARMHSMGVYHLDFSPGNILFDEHDGKVEFTLVDINRMTFQHRPISMRKGCKNFARLWGKEDFFVLLANEYARARGLDKARCELLTIKYWRRFWRHRK